MATARVFSKAYTYYDRVMKQAISFTNTNKAINKDKGVEWEIAQGDQTVGSVFLSLENEEYCDAPFVSVNLNPGQQETEELYTEALKHSIKYTYCNVPCEFLFIRHPLNNALLQAACQGLGFETDEDQYEYDGQSWQNMKITL